MAIVCKTLFLDIIVYVHLRMNLYVDEDPPCHIICQQTDTFLWNKLILLIIENGCKSKDKGDCCKEKMKTSKLSFHRRVKVNQFIHRAKFGPFYCDKTQGTSHLCCGKRKLLNHHSVTVEPTASLTTLPRRFSLLVKKHRTFSRI